MSDKQTFIDSVKLNQDELDRAKYAEEQMIKNIQDFLTKQIDKIKMDTNLSQEEKLIKMSVIVNTSRFIKDYKKNCNLLDKFQQDLRFDQKEK